MIKAILRRIFRVAAAEIKENADAIEQVGILFL
jgi:hypothetical protein